MWCSFGVKHTVSLVSVLRRESSEKGSTGRLSVTLLGNRVGRERQGANRDRERKNVNYKEHRAQRRTSL